MAHALQHKYVATALFQQAGEDARLGHVCVMCVLKKHPMAIVQVLNVVKTVPVWITSAPIFLKPRAL
jgi:hypothetical protein